MNKLVINVLDYVNISNEINYLRNSIISNNQISSYDLELKLNRINLLKSIINSKK